MNDPEAVRTQDAHEPPGIFSSWRQLYVSVIVYTVTLIVLLQLLSSLLVAGSGCRIYGDNTSLNTSATSRPNP